MARRSTKTAKAGTGKSKEPEPAPTAVPTTQDPQTVPAAPVPSTGADHDPKKKKKAIITRAIFGFSMIGGASLVLASGPLAIVLFLSVIQFFVYKELAGLFDLVIPSQYSKEDNVDAPAERVAADRVRRRWRRRVTWSFYFAANYALYGIMFIAFQRRQIYTPISPFLDTKVAVFLLRNHLLISFLIYIVCFVVFVARLKRRQLRDQFGLFAWVHVLLLIIVAVAHLIMENIITGIIWFWIPISLVVMNDCAAYACGLLFGRRQLIALSPKKTVEGFVGAFVLTLFFGYAWSTIFSSFNYMVCPLQDLTLTAFSRIPECKVDPIFVWHHADLPKALVAALTKVLPKSYVPVRFAYSEFQGHAIIMSIFASLVAPFGGFFASGFKRAFRIKDFGHTIPGHGGLTDRFDCQFIMGAFTFAYQSSVTLSLPSVTNLVQTIALLPRNDQLQLYNDLATLLKL